MLNNIEKDEPMVHVPDQQCLHFITSEASAGGMPYKINYQSITGDNEYVWIIKVSGNEGNFECN